MGHFDSMTGWLRLDKIREWSYGEVKKPETINYRTQAGKGRPFLERIFADPIGVPLRKV